MSLRKLDSTRPSVTLNFKRSKKLDPRVTFTRASYAPASGPSSGTGTVGGQIMTFNVDVPRLTDQGLLIEQSGTNTLLNSGTLVTQSVTTSATKYTLSFEGTGTVVLSGTATGTLVGTGENDRVSLTVTATAGTCTATVTGTVTNAQFERGSFPTSYIPTTTAEVTRAGDICQITGDDFSSWWNSSEGTTVTTATGFPQSDYRWAWEFNNGTTASSGPQFHAFIISYQGFASPVNGNTQDSDIQLPTVSEKTAFAWATGDIAGSGDGSAVVTNTSGVDPRVTRIIIGNGRNFNTFLNGNIQQISYYPTRVSNAALRGLTQ